MPSCVSLSTFSPAQGNLNFLPTFERGPYVFQMQILLAPCGAFGLIDSGFVDVRPDLSRAPPPAQPHTQPLFLLVAHLSAPFLPGLGTPPPLYSLLVNRQVIVAPL